MPEGDTVWLTAHRLDQALAGRALTLADLRVPALATADLRGRTVTDVLARGKHILTRLDEDLTLHSHLRMDGSWHLSRAGERTPRRRPGHLIRVLLGNSEWRATGYRIHDLRLVRRAAEAELVGHLGPDLLGPDWDPVVAVANLLGAPGVAVGEALLDQRNLAGIGNLYKCEVLFVERLHPWTPVARGARAAPAGRHRAAAAAGQSRPSGAVDHRLPAARPRALGLRTRRRTVPALPHADQPGRAGHATSGAKHVLVPAVPAGSLSRIRPCGSRPARRRPAARAGRPPAPRHRRRRPSARRA